MNWSLSHEHSSGRAIEPGALTLDQQDRQAEGGPTGYISLQNVYEGLTDRRANKRSLLIVFRQLALLVETGIDLSEAIELAAESCKTKALQQSLEDIYEDINAGVGLGTAVANQENRLGSEVVASVQAGEAAGRLVEVLRQIADQLEEEMQMRATILGALAYPLILCFAAGAVACILMWFVLPQFESSFDSMGVTPPVFTRYLLETAGWIRGNVVIVSTAALAAAVGIGFVTVQPNARRVFNDLCFSSPILGPALRYLSVGQLFVSLGHLLRNGISLLEALQLVRRSSTAGATKRLVEVWENDVIEGRGLTHSLGEFDFLPEGAAAMLIMAERTGKLENVLTTVGAHYRTEGSGRLKLVLKLSEPLIIIVLGVFVGVVVASVLLPMLDVQSASAGG